MFISDRARGGAWGNVRDVGVALRGTTARMDVQAGAFNGAGEGQNAADRNTGKYLVGRVVGRPGIPGLHAGFSGLHGGAGSTSDPVRRRFGADVQYARRNLVVRSEFVTGTDGDIPRRGHYEYLGFKPVPAFELTLRHDVWDPDRRKDSSIADALTRDDLLGFNYFLQDHYAKVQVNVTRRTFQAAALRPAILLNLGVQTAW